MPSYRNSWILLVDLQSYKFYFLEFYFVLLATITDSTYALVTSGVGKLITQRVGFQKIQKYVTGGIYITLGVAAAVTGSGRK